MWSIRSVSRFHINVIIAIYQLATKQKKRFADLKICYSIIYQERSEWPQCHCDDNVKLWMNVTFSNQEICHRLTPATGLFVSVPFQLNYIERVGLHKRHGLNWDPYRFPTDLEHSESCNSTSCACLLFVLPGIVQWMLRRPVKIYMRFFNKKHSYNSRQITAYMIF